MPFIAYDVALEAIRLLRPLIAKLRRRNASLADQCDRSSQAVALLLAEGSGKRNAARANCYRNGVSEAREARGCLDVDVAAGHLEPAEIADAWRCLDRVVGLLWSITK